MTSRSFICVTVLVVVPALGCGSEPKGRDGQSSSEAVTACAQAAPTATGSFVASGNDSPDPSGATANPIVAVEASGHVLTFTSQNGEHGTITLSGATASGSFRDAWGLAQLWLAPFDGHRPNAPVDTLQLSGGAGRNFPIVLSGAKASTMNGGFAFASPLDGSTPYVVAVKATGSEIAFSDAWGAVGTITLSPGPSSAASRCAE